MKPTLKYISNTCDVDGLEDFGEHAVVILEERETGKPGHTEFVIYHHDHSDEYMDVEDSLSAHREIAKILKCKVNDIVLKHDDTISLTTVRLIKRYFKLNNI